MGLGEIPPARALAIHSASSLDGEVMKKLEVNPLEQIGFGPSRGTRKGNDGSINLIKRVSLISPLFSLLGLFYLASRNTRGPYTNQKNM